jgi:myo-inositol 2-dehydrogenase/D-chiro-inositol 1-dehydrogenase
LRSGQIRTDKSYNETERCAKSCLTAIMGRMACESGTQITWDEAFACNLELAPGLAALKWDSDPPAKAGPGGKYEVAMPGQTQVC